MKKSVEPLPRLDLAPKLNRPLSLWNPLDYLRLLYWVFYFPQALRWYVDTFGGGYIPEDQMNVRKGWQILRENAIQRHLLIQGILLILTIPTSLCWFLEQLGFVIHWFGVALSVALGLAFSVVFGVVFGVAFSVAFGVVFGVVFGVILSIRYIAYIALQIAYTIALKIILKVADTISLSLDEYIRLRVALGVIEGVHLGLAFGVVYGVTSGVAWGIKKKLTYAIVLCISFLLVHILTYNISGDIVYSIASGIALGVGFGLASCLALGMGFGFAGGIALSVITSLTYSLVQGLVGGVMFSCSYSVAYILSTLRLDDWFASILAHQFNSPNGRLLFARTTTLPLPYIKQILKQSLYLNWEEGIYNINQLLRYTHQSKIIIEIINNFLVDITSENLIWKTSKLAESPYIWSLFPYLSSKVATSFYLLHEQETQDSIRAFENVRYSLYGEEMYILAQTLDLCTQAKEFNQIHPLTLPPCPEPDPEKRLRQTSWTALEAFHRVTQEAQLIHRSTGKATRAQALARAQGELKHILDNADQLPQAEGGLILDIATTWRDALLNIASDIGNVEILEPVQNPYTIGDPVEGDRFVGREDILRELESIWLGADNPPSVLIYGHRRMGKTSILRNLTGGSDLKLIYVNLQLLGSVTQGLSEVLLAIADDIAQHLDIPAPPDDAFLTFPQRTFERYLRDVLKRLDCRALIIALDEFELIEDLIEAGQLTPDFMGYLRGLIQMDKRLAFALAGLHTLEEMTRDYFQPFFGSTYPLRVGFLSSAATRQILENPSEDFPLEYDPDAVDEIYRLTHGQPYLVQLIGFQLVRRFNELVFETPTFISTSLNERISTPLIERSRNERSRNERNARLTLEDVATVTNIFQGDLFRNGRYYFDGIWNQASQHPPGQTDILQALAPHPTGLTTEELQSQCPHVPDLTAALETLQRHDVVRQTGERWHIRVELCRRWIAARA